jgi:hypothetical protein
MGYKHYAVNHSAGEYVGGIVHTANLDSFWSLLKRGVKEPKFKADPEDRLKPITLAPLSFDEAMAGFIAPGGNRKTTNRGKAKP